MTKDDALKYGYCKRCAGYATGRWLCGVGLGLKDNSSCRMPQEAQERFKAEWGLQGETRRYIKTEFGDRDQMKKKRRKRK